MNIKELVEMYPNNTELGAKVRQLYWKQKEEQDRLERIQNENLRIKINNEKASRLFIK